MGKCCSCCFCCKKKDEEEDEETEVLDPAKSFWDDDGNIRTGWKVQVSRQRQLREIIMSDTLDEKLDLTVQKAKKDHLGNIIEEAKDNPYLDKDGGIIEDALPETEWYIMSSTWLAAWLDHVYHNPEFAPSPGPCDNHRLLRYDVERGVYTGRLGLRMAVEGKEG